MRFVTKTTLQYLAIQSTSLCFANALVEDGTHKFGTVSAKQFIDPSLSAVRETIFEEAESLPSLSGLAGMEFPSIASSGHHLFSHGASSNGKVTVDSRSGVIATLDLAAPILPGRGTGNRLLWSVGAMPEADNIHGEPTKHVDWEALAEEAVKNWMHENQSFLGINSQDELFSAGRTRMAVHGNGDMIQLSIQRTYHDIVVVENRATATIKLGNLINVGFEHWSEIPKEFDIIPSITEQDAFDVLAAHMGLEIVMGKESCKPELQILTMVTGSQPSVATETIVQSVFHTRGGKKAKKEKEIQNVGTTTDGERYTYALTWKVCPIFVGQQQEVMEGFVDAHTSQVYSFIDKVDYFNAHGSVYPITNDGQGPDGVSNQDWPMPFMEVGNEITTTGGNYENESSQTARFYGPYVDMKDDCGLDNLSQDGGIDWGTSDGTDCSTPGFGGSGNTHSSRTGFYELNKIKEIARSRLPNNSWLQGRLTANMNINDSCNAFWDGTSVNFFRSGNGCGNPGEIAGIFDHEWGHGMDDNDVVGGIASPSGEGIADLYSTLRLGDSCIGRGFYSRKCYVGGECLTCTGVRDIDYAKKTKNAPFTHSDSIATCGGSDHCIGVVYSEAVWDLYKRHLQSAPYNYDDNTALEIVTRLTYIAAGNIATWFSGIPESSGCGNNSGYRAYLAADDDDGNISNGTPHMDAIFTAFNNHEIACPQSQIPVKESGCANTPTIQPEVSAMAGNMEVTLTWNSVPGAEKYQLLRTEGVFQCSQGKVLLGETSETTFVDKGLQNGREYYYIVIPMGINDACYGPSSECKAVAPVEAADFYLSCPSEPVIFKENATPQSEFRDCTVTAIGDYSGTISLECSGLDGISCTVPQTIIIASGQTQAIATLNIIGSPSVGKGDSNVIISATAGSIVKTSSVDVHVLSEGGAQVALYDNTLTVPKCQMHGNECDSASLLVGRGFKGPEPNFPNTLDSCDDGSFGSFHSDESMDRIVVKSADGNNMVEGSLVTVTATVWAWGTGTSDRADFYYASDASNPNWIFIDTLVPPGGGARDLRVSYTLPDGHNQAVRVNYRYKGSASPCPGGQYDDTDDLAFAVIKNPVQIAMFDATFKAPRCTQLGTECNSDNLVEGRGSAGPESGSPNTIDGCADGASGKFHVDESIDKVIVRAGEVDGTGAEGFMTEGQYATIIATVYAWSTGANDRADFYYTSDATALDPVWEFIGTLTPLGGGQQELKMQYKLPEGSTQAVRVGFRYRGSQSPCTSGNYNDRDDIIFEVQKGLGMDPPTRVGVPQVATYDDILGVPACWQVGNECDSVELLNGRGTMNNGNEVNAPNTLDSCSDGNKGAHQIDESIEKIVVRSGEIDGTGAEKEMTEGGRATITATVFSYGSTDQADFYYKNGDLTNPDWVLIDTVTPPAGGSQELQVSYTLPPGDNQAVRVNFRYRGSESPCSTGGYDERDDLAFAVRRGASALSAWNRPVETETKPDIEPTYDEPNKDKVDKKIKKAKKKKEKLNKRNEVHFV